MSKKNPTDYTYTARDGKKYTLSKREKKFCDKYLEFGAKAVDAIYAAGYDPKNKNTAYSMASEYLRKPKFFNYINMMYEEHGFNDEDVMREHLFLIKQLGDLPTKARGVDMYYKKSGGYAPEEVEHTIRNYSDLTDEELKELHDKKTKQKAKK